MALLRGRNEGREDQILVVRVSVAAMKKIENCGAVSEVAQNGVGLPQNLEMNIGRVKGKGPLEIRMDLLPESAHEMPALRPGIGCLLVTRSGRRAPLELGDLLELPSFRSSR